MAEDESYLPASIQYSANWTGLASAIATALIGKRELKHLRDY
jgi:hypothetical protein